MLYWCYIDWYSVFLLLFFLFLGVVCLFKQKTAYGVRLSLVSSEMCMGDRFMKVRFENIDRQTPANLAIQVRTLLHKFDGLYLQTAHLPKGRIYIRHPVLCGH